MICQTRAGNDKGSFIITGYFDSMGNLNYKVTVIDRYGRSHHLPPGIIDVETRLSTWNAIEAKLTAQLERAMQNYE